jgi:hypothetical protein
MCRCYTDVPQQLQHCPQLNTTAPFWVKRFPIDGQECPSSCS